MINKWICTGNKKIIKAVRYGDGDAKLAAKNEAGLGHAVQSRGVGALVGAATKTKQSRRLGNGTYLERPPHSLNKRSVAAKLLPKHEGKKSN